ncbi:MAG: ATP synthase F1 subunit delta [Pseudomonadota bacterium]
MIAGSLARRYARALFAIGASKGTYETLGREVEEMAGLYSTSRDLTLALTSPAIPSQKRRAVLEAVLRRAGIAGTTRSFLLALLERKRIEYLPVIAAELRTMVDDRAGRVRVEVTSARPLLADQVTRLSSLLERVAGKRVILDQRKDPELLGGVVAKLGDVVYDGSLRSQLEQMRERFLA